MGLSASKIGKNISEGEFQEGSIPTTPILTPKIEKLSIDSDPRSPSANISRTPIEILTAAAKRLQHFEEDESSNDVISETPSRDKPLILGIDPRSPTTDFTRTPIIVNASERMLPKKIQNKNLNKVKQSEIKLFNTKDSMLIKPEESSFISQQTKSPKLLGSSAIKSKIDTCKRKSFVGLLETNIDFTETDLDVVMQTKHTIIPEGSNSPNQIDHKDINKNIDNEESNTNMIIESESPIQNGEISNERILIDTTDSLLIDCEEQGTHSEENSPNNKNFKQSEDIVNLSNKSIDINSHEKNNIDVDTEGVDISGDIKSAPVSPPHINLPKSPILVTKESKSAPVSPPTINITATVRELDQKLTNLIYEDDIIVCPRIVKLKEPIERSPLKNRNGCEPLRLQKLKVSDKPRKSEYAVSKIPIFKEKGKSEVQCENTPPRKLEIKKGKMKKCNWDNTDTTLYL